FRPVFELQYRLDSVRSRRGSGRRCVELRDERRIDVARYIDVTRVLSRKARLPNAIAREVVRGTTSIPPDRMPGRPGVIARSGSHAEMRLGGVHQCALCSTFLGPPPDPRSPSFRTRNLSNVFRKSAQR